MSDPINLNKARKAKARRDAKTLAAENRAKFGRTKVERSAAENEARTFARHIDAHKRDS